MAIYLDEDQVGSDRVAIGYPHLLLCMGVTVLMNDGGLIGAHFSSGHTESEVGAELGKVITSYGGRMIKLYLTADLAEHYDKGGGDYRTKARLIGYTGRVFTFDCGKIKPKDGTFVELHSLGNGVVDVTYKRNEKMAYTTVLGDRPSNVSGPGTKPRMVFKLTATTAKTHGRHHAPTFHRVSKWTVKDV